MVGPTEPAEIAATAPNRIAIDQRQDVRQALREIGPVPGDRRVISLSPSGQICLIVLVFVGGAALAFFLMGQWDLLPIPVQFCLL